MKLLFLYCSSSVQFFNYGIFGLAASNLADAFLPGESNLEKILNFFFLVILSSITRPLASFIFGAIGDKFGRKNAIIIASIVSNIGAIMVAFIPTYEEVGVIATAVLIVARILFLAGLTGDIDGVRVYISELSGKSREYSANGIISLSTQIGALAASSVLSFFSSQYFLFSFTIALWRICFFIGGFLGILLSISRFFLKESPDFLEHQNKKHNIFPIEFSQILRSHLSIILYQSIIFGSIGSFYHFFIICLPIYIDTIDDTIQLNPTLYLSTYAFGGLFWGFIFDQNKKLAHPNLLRIWIVALIILIFASISFLQYKYLHFLITICCFIQSGVSVTSYVFLKNHINIAIRYRIFSLAHSLGSAIISSPTSYFCTKLAIIMGHEFIALVPFVITILAIYSQQRLQKQPLD